MGGLTLARGGSYHRGMSDTFQNATNAPTAQLTAPVTVDLPSPAHPVTPSPCHGKSGNSASTAEFSPITGLPRTVPRFLFRYTWWDAVPVFFGFVHAAYLVSMF